MHTDSQFPSILEWFLPRFTLKIEPPSLEDCEGSVASMELSNDFAQRLADRVERGLLVPGNRQRANYEVVSLEPDAIRIRAADMWTAITVGFNDIEIRRSGDGRGAECRVTYWRWMAYCMGLGAVLFVLLAASLALMPQMRQEIAAYPWGGAIFWGNIVFWCLLWPPVLTGLHKKPAMRALEKIVSEEVFVWPDESSNGAEQDAGQS